MKRVVLSWSSGKDSAWSHQVLQQDPTVEIVGLLCTLNAEYDRVAMHAVRKTILDMQAERLALDLTVVPLPWPCSNSIYEQMMKVAIDSMAGRGVTHVAFGDLYLEDVREYREKMMGPTPLEPLFPIWGEPTGPLSRKMVDGGIEAVITCIDPKKLSRDFAGRKYDHSFLDDLPDGVDPCGENGEFHTCVLNAPGYTSPIAATVGEIVERDNFVFADVVP